MATEETASYVGNMNALVPDGTGGSLIKNGDDELRKVKSILTATFPSVTGAVTATHTQLNQLAGVTVGGTSAGDVATIDGTQTLTNKTIAAGSNTISGLTLGSEVTGASTSLSDTSALTYNADTDVSANGWVIDEDTMTSNLATKVPTQQSVKAYVDAEVAAAGKSTFYALTATTSVTINATQKIVAQYASSVTLPTNGLIVFKSFVGRIDESTTGTSIQIGFDIGSTGGVNSAADGTNDYFTDYTKGAGQDGGYFETSNNNNDLVYSGVLQDKNDNYFTGAVLDIAAAGLSGLSGNLSLTMTDSGAKGVVMESAVTNARVVIEIIDMD